MDRVLRWSLLAAAVSDECRSNVGRVVEQYCYACYTKTTNGHESYCRDPQGRDRGPAAKTYALWRRVVVECNLRNVQRLVARLSGGDVTTTETELKTLLELDDFQDLVVALMKWKDSN